MSITMSIIRSNKEYNPKGTYKASEYEFPYKKASFDFVILSSTFTHMLPDEVPNYLSEIERVMKPGGRAMITFFLLNRQSLKLIEAGKSAIGFKHHFGVYRIKEESTPEAAIAYQEDFVRNLYRENGLKIAEPVHYGSWYGREAFLSYQDIVVAHKPSLPGFVPQLFRRSASTALMDVYAEDFKADRWRCAKQEKVYLTAMAKPKGLRVVAFGGGTGLPVLLRGLKDRVGDLVAVVTVADDGGSSGRLRQELGVAPPGDVRNCLVALAGRKGLAEVFNYRFEGREGDLSDHSVGNIIIAALSDMAGGFCEGVEQAARFLRTKGWVFPAAVESLTLVAHYVDGAIVRGESAVSAMHQREGRILRIEVEPEGAPAPPGVIKAVEEADVVVLSSGSLFTSTVPSLLGAGTREALANFAGPIVYVANVMTQPGETTGFR